MAQKPDKEKLVIVGRGVPPLKNLKNAPTWTKTDEQGRKIAQCIPTENGVHIRLFDAEATVTSCYVRYDKLIEEADSASKPE